MNYKRMSFMKDTVISKYSVIGDDIYYHHTLSVSDGRDYHVSPEAHTQYEVLYLLGGALTYVIDGERYTVKEGDMIFVSPNELHSLEISGKMPYERIVLLFDMEILRVMMKSMFTISSRPLIFRSLILEVLFPL